MSAILEAIAGTPFAHVRDRLDSLGAAPPQVLLLEGGTETQRLDAALYWACRANCPDAERDGSPYIIADDFGTIAVVKVAARGDGFPNIELDREAFEDVAASYLKDHDTEDAQVRPDLIELWVVNSNRALLRHNIGCVLADCAA